MQDRRGKWCAIPRPRCPGVADCQVTQSPEVKADLVAALRWHVLFARQIDRSWQHETGRLIKEVSNHHKRRCATSLHHAEVAHRAELQQMGNECQSWQRNCRALQQQVQKLERHLDEMENNQCASLRLQRDTLERQVLTLQSELTKACTSSRPSASCSGAQAAAVVHERMPKWAPMRGPKKKKKRCNGRHRDEGEDSDSELLQILESTVDQACDKLAANLDKTLQKRLQAAAAVKPDAKGPATLADIKALFASPI